MQFTANNIDVNDSLLGGKDTFHATQVPGWQRGPNKTKHLASLRPADRTALVIPEALCSNCRQLISWKTKVSRYLQNLLNRSGIRFLYFCLASGILSRNQCFQTQRRQAGRKLEIYRSLPLRHSIQTRRLRWFGFRLVHHWLRNSSHFVCTGQCGCTKVDTNCCIKRCYNSLTRIKKKY